MSNEGRSGPSILQTLKDLRLTLGIVWSANVWLTLLLVGLEVLNGLIPAWLTGLLKQLIDTLMVEAHAHQQDLHPVIGWTFLLVGGGILDLATALAVDINIQWLKERTDLEATLRILRKVTELDLAQQEAPEFQDLLDLASKEVRSAPLETVHYLGAAVGNLAKLLALGALLWQLGAWFVPLGLGLAAVPASVAQTFWGWVGYWTLRRNTPQQRQLSYVFKILTSIEYFIEVRLYRIAPFMIDRYRSIWEELSREIWRLTGQRCVAQLGAGVVWNLATGAAYVYAGFRLLSGQIDLAELAQYYTAISIYRGGVQNLMEAVAKIYGSVLFARSLFELEKYHPLITSPVTAEPAARGRGLEVEFRGVCFEYTPGQPVLKDLSFTMKGESTALVGLNGAGKSTLLKLLMRFYDPTEGSILINGRNIREYDLDDLRSMISAVVQDFNLFEFSMAENIGLGHLPLIEDQGKVEEAARRSHIHPVIARMADGYRTLLGTAFKKEGGPASTRLSGGQRQLLALARCLIRPAGLLILDEWTSSLDPEVVATLIKDLEEATKGSQVTQLVISHTLSVAKKCQQILVLESGRILEKGTHAELMQLGGRYAELYNKQAEAYK